MITGLGREKFENPISYLMVDKIGELIYHNIDVNLKWQEKLQIMQMQYEFFQIELSFTVKVLAEEDETSIQTI